MYQVSFTLYCFSRNWLVDIDYNLAVLNRASDKLESPKKMTQLAILKAKRETIGGNDVQGLSMNVKLNVSKFDLYLVKIVCITEIIFFAFKEIMDNKSIYNIEKDLALLSVYARVSGLRIQK
jgi:hypothetical protein